MCRQLGHLALQRYTQREEVISIQAWAVVERHDGQHYNSWGW